jgi:hypothetical protein
MGALVKELTFGLGCAAVLSLATIPIGLFVASLQLTALLAILAGALLLEARTHPHLGE